MIAILSAAFFVAGILFIIAGMTVATLIACEMIQGAG